ncbi:unnamed protein product [Paramecium sonneborni]|uniref:Uncharacterized protein n=1 Tax=Paramecium sonneborni TaxID=65129 RepID=A0A8S1Q941_9CILI|nr:unnamed protein product [Paramecium sonneborni]CAD8112189.1 unnamed protein product [Paramecium sonneborni]
MFQSIELFKELIKSAVVYRYMKPANFLNNMSTVKIADYRFAKYVGYYSSSLLNLVLKILPIKHLKFQKILLQHQM